MFVSLVSKEICCLVVLLASTLASAMVTLPASTQGESDGTSIHTVSTNAITQNVQIHETTPTSKLAESITVRRTRENDIPLISELLAYEVHSGTNGTPGVMTNWNTNLQRMKAKASFTTQLRHRRNAIDIASKVRSNLLESAEDGSSLEPIQMKQLVYANDPFRNALERAVSTSTDFEDAPRTDWNNHNFALNPPSNLLQHVMVSAFDPYFYPCEDGSGSNEDALVGFCEVAMLPSPLKKTAEDPDNECSSIPCIMNLVVSPNHRRRGIATKLLRMMTRYAQIHFMKEEGDIVGLYVDGDNAAAIALYTREGFVKASECEQVEGRIFMKYCR